MTENKLPECPYYVAHPQSVWFNEHWRPVIEQLQKENKENKQLKSLMSVQIDMVEQNKQMSDEIAALKSKLKIAVDALEWYSDKNNLDLSESVIMEDGAKAEQALTEIGEI